MKKKNDLKLQVNEAILACQDKQADNVTVLELEKDSGAFTDYFVMCSGTNPRQIQAIADAVDERLEALGLRVTHAEGYKQAEWVLLDYVDFVVHIFSEKARQFYDLERLWKSAKRLEPAELMAKAKLRTTTIESTTAKSTKHASPRPKRREKRKPECPPRIQPRGVLPTAWWPRKSGKQNRQCWAALSRQRWWNTRVRFPACTSSI
jgi:ribosome-associated protein